MYVILFTLFVEPGLFPELPGPAVGPKGPKISQKTGAGFIMLSSLKSTKNPETESLDIWNQRLGRGRQSAQVGV